MGDQGGQVCDPRLTLQPGGQHFYIRAGTRLKIRLQSPYIACKREAAVPEEPLFGTCLFVCAKDWVLRHSRSLNTHVGPWVGWGRWPVSVADLLQTRRRGFFGDCVCRPYNGHFAGLRRAPWGGIKVAVIRGCHNQGYLRAGIIGVI